MANATNCKNYNDNGRATGIDIEALAIETAIEAMRIIIRNDKEMI